jgi:hypothetical protein
MVLTIAMISMLTQTPPPMVAADAAPADAEPMIFHTHVRFGIGWFQGANGFANGGGNLNLALAGAYLRFGLQLSDRFGVELEGAAASCAFTDTVRGAIWLDYTANDYVTLAAGGAYALNQEHIIGLFDNPSHTVSATTPAVVERIDFHFISSRNSEGGRKGFTLGLMAEESPNQSAPGGVGLGAYVTMGFSYW